MALALAGAGCGTEQRVVTTTVYKTVTTPPPAPAGDRVPDIGRGPVRDGEVVIRGSEAPKTYGPYDFEPGAYDFRFAQYAPGRDVDFRTDVSSFTAVVTRKPNRTAPDTQVLSNATTRAGAGSLTLAGKLFVEVQSADYSYVMRFSPRDAP